MSIVGSYVHASKPGIWLTDKPELINRVKNCVQKLNPIHITLNRFLRCCVSLNSHPANLISVERKFAHFESW